MLQIWLLGQFDVRVEGKRVVIGSRAAQSLLAFLVLSPGTAHRREKLAGMLWPEMSDENARSNLRHELWRVRKALTSPLSLAEPSKSSPRQFILADELTISFNPDGDYWLDVEQLARVASPDDTVNALISSLTLYRGELLPGFYDDWAGLERDRVQSLFESKMQHLLEQLIAEQRWLTVLEWAERWIALGQTPEPAYRALMVAHGAMGDPIKIALDYERCVEALRDDVGVEPSRETRALYETLMGGEKNVARVTAPLPTMFVQPSGTVTFLFTDLEGSTRLLEQLGNDYAILLGDQRDLLRTTAETHNGYEVDTQGDAFFFAFFRAADAVSFAADAQRALAAHKWPRDVTPRVRMGLHTGEPMLSRTGYVGMDVHRAARIGAAGHGGQVLMSRTTRDLIEHDLPPNTHLDDLGEYKLKDLRYPVHIIQLTLTDLPSSFPPLKSQGTGGEPPAPGEPPFKGLQFFDQADAHLFFGRELLTAQLVSRLQGASLAVVVGASGSGKSSLVRAGVIGAMKRGEPLANGTLPPAHSTAWAIHVITPTAHPLESLAIELTRDTESVTATTTLIDDLARDPRALYLWVRRMTNDGRRMSNDDYQINNFRPPSLFLGHTLLVVDQFEELFTLCRDELEREQFIDNLLTAIVPDAGGLVTLILTIRADFYAHLAQYPELRDAVAEHQEFIGPMTAEELRRAMEEPARRGGWEFEPGLVDLILRDVGDEPGALPLLSHALLATWTRRSGHTMTLKGYADAGGVRGAIAQTAESVYQQFSPEQQVIARNIFLRLTELGEATEDTRRRAEIRELVSRPEDAEQVREVLTRLADARLVTTGENSAEVAHEALIREWDRLREWLNQDREGLRLHRQITEASQEWELLERDPGALYRGARLAQAQEFASQTELGSYPDTLNEGERAFLTASVENERREEAERTEARQRELLAKEQLLGAEQLRLKQERVANRRLRRRAILLAGAFVFAVALAGIALFLGDQARASALAAQQQQRLAAARELAASAISNLSVDPERSILLATHAVSTTYAIDKTWTTEAEDALRRGLEASRVELTLHDHTDAVSAVAFSPDGSRVASASDDGTAKIWDATTGQPMLTISTNATLGMHGMEFSPDGTRLATAGEDGTAKIWDAHTGQELVLFPGHTDWVSDVAFSPDGTRLATASEDRTAKVWNSSSGEELLTLRGHTFKLWDVAFSRDGSRLATGSDDRTAIIWDASTGKELLTLTGHTAPVFGVAFSPDGARLATASLDRTVRIWGANDGKELLTLRAPADIYTRVAFSPDGARLVASNFDGKVRVWDSNTGKELFILTGHAAPVIGIAFSPDGGRLASASWDGTAKVWNMSLSRERLTLSIPELNAGSSDQVEFSPDLNRGQIEPISILNSGAFSPDGSRLAAGFKNGKAKVWDISGLKGAEIASLQGHRGAINRAAFSPDGTHLATASEDGTVKIWDMATGKELLSLHGHTAGVYGLAYSPDGKQLATTSTDYTARVWDISAVNDASRTGNTGLPLKSEAALLTLSLPNTWSFPVTFSPDGRRLAVGLNDGTVQLWDIAAGKEILNFQAHAGEVWGIAFSPDGARLGTASNDKTARVWDTATGKELLLLDGHNGSVEGIAFNPDATQLATASLDGTVKVWDSATGQETATLYGHTDPVAGVTFSADGQRILTASYGGIIRIYFAKIEDLMTLASSRVSRALTPSECQQFLHLPKDRCRQDIAAHVSPPATFPTSGIVRAQDAKGKLCQVADVLGFNDQYFNQIAHVGVLEAQERFGWETAVLESREQSEYEKNINTFLQSGCTLIIVPNGFYLTDPIKRAALANPNQKFQIMEVVYTQRLDNVWQQVYAIDQAGFLAGYIAAAVSKTGKVATYGGINIPPVAGFMDGYALGVAYYNEQNGTHVQVLGWDVKKREGLFTSSFDNPDDGRRMGDRLMDEGADIILPVANYTGLGTAAAIKERGGAHLIGVDSDWAVTFPEYADITLTSIEKRLDVSVLSAVQAIVAGTFTGGTHIGTLENGGVGIAPFHELDALVSPKVKADLERIKADIIAGKIKTTP